MGLRRAALPSRAASRNRPIRAVVTVVKSAVASQAVEPALIRPPVSTAGSVSSGPYVVKPAFFTPRPSRSSSRQYGAVTEAGRYTPVIRTRTAGPSSRSARVSRSPGRSRRVRAAASGSATSAGSVAGRGNRPSVSRS